MSDPLCEVLKCTDCGKLGVALNGVRITNHKCAGHWTVIAYESFYPDVVMDALGGMVAPGPNNKTT